MQDDICLKQDIEEEIASVASIDDTQVNVAVNQGLVTISGRVPSFAEKSLAERAAARVAGVASIANHLRVHLSPDDVRTDKELNAACVTALKTNRDLPAGSVSVVVNRGWITLTGEVKTRAQREAAGRAIRYLTGVIGVINHVLVCPRPLGQRFNARSVDVVSSA